MGLKTLALIIPAYNEERHLKACLDSIAAQTVPPDEVIVIDNNSTDKTVEAAKSYDFVTVLKENKQGIVFARNRGFDHAKSDIIGRIDADTILPKHWVAYVKRFYASPKHDRSVLTGGGYFYNVSFPPKFLNGWLQSQVAFRFNRFIMGHYILWGSNMAMTREQWRAVRDNVCLRTDIHEDLDLAIHLHRQNYQIAYRANLKVGVAMRRVFDDWHHLRENMLWWPRTLKSHNIRRWVFGWIGAYSLFLLSPILKLVNLPFKLLR